LNILIINHYAGAPELGREFRPYYLARAWQQAGHRVLVAAADHSHLRSNDPVLGGPTEQRTIGGVEYLLFATPRYNDSIAGRGRNIGAFVARLWRAAPRLARDFGPNVVLGQSGYPFEYGPARRIAALAGAPLVTELRDLWPLCLQEQYHYRGGHPAVVLAAQALRRQLAASGLVVTVLPGAAEYLSGYGLPEGRCAVVPAGIAVPKGVAPPPAAHVRQLARWREKGLLTVMYCGNIGADHDLRSFVESAARLRGEALLVLVGNGGSKIPLKRRAKELGLDNVLFLDGVPRGQIQGMMEQSDCLFFPVRPDGQLRYGAASSKLLGYMLAGRPVLCDRPFAHNPAEEAGCCLTAAAPDAAGLAAGVRAAAALGAERRREMGEKGERFVRETRDYRLLAQTYLELLTGLKTGQDTPQS